MFGADHPRSVVDILRPPLFNEERFANSDSVLIPEMRPDRPVLEGRDDRSFPNPSQPGFKNVVQGISGASEFG